MTDSQSTRQKILLESGTNELEILVFTLRKQQYGVNVAKVREVIDPPEVTGLPESHDAVNGVFTLRDSVTPLISLRHALKLPASDDSTTGKIILLEFNDIRVGFLVDTVERIHRVNWKDVTAMPDMSGVRSAPVTSVASLDGKLVQLLDFEKLMFDIGGQSVLSERAARIEHNEDRGSQHILLAEDSHLMRTLIKQTLNDGGYSNVTACADGKIAWDALQKSFGTPDSVPFDLVVTDIEMPGMDGLHLTRRLKDQPQLQHIPVVLFSSLVSADNEKKCKAVGADAQITKPQLDELVKLLDKLILNTEQPVLV